MDVITLAAMGTVGPIQVSAAARQRRSNSTTFDADPRQTGAGIRWESGPLYVGGSYIATDRDDGSDEDAPSMIEALTSYGFGNGLSAQLSVSQLDTDTSDDAGNTTGAYALLDHRAAQHLRQGAKPQRG